MIKLMKHLEVIMILKKLEKTIIFFAPGIPQIYYVGMLAGENDLELKNENY